MNRILALVLCAVLALCVSLQGSSLAQPSKLFTIDQVMSAPFPSAITASSTGKIAWVQNAKGVRNIW
ncbi:MAG TPA: hypothetical protein VIV66_22085, partial [Pyrinomonadaceae bacterium]